MQKNIVCFGDSNTHGYRAEDTKRFDEHTRWTKLLQKALGDGYNIVEEGLSGRTTCFEDPCFEGLSGVSVIYPTLMSHEPVDLLVIMLGTNDVKERFSATAANIASGLERLVKKARSVECWSKGIYNILIITPTPILKGYEKTDCYSMMGAGCSEKSYELHSVFEAVAKNNGCHYLNAAFAESNTIDYMHLCPNGHRQLSEKLAELIPTIL